MEHDSVIEKVDERVSINLTASERRALEQVARQQLRTLASVARVAIREYLARWNDDEAAA